MSDQLLIKIAAFNYIFHQHVLLKLNITIINRILNKFSLIHIFQKSIQVNNKAMMFIDSSPERPESNDRI